MFVKSKPGVKRLGDCFSVHFFPRTTEAKSDIKLFEKRRVHDDNGEIWRNGEI
jgi:hypothetical protein